MQALSFSEFKKYTTTKAVLIIDTRHQNDFVKDYIPTSLFMGIDGPFEKWMPLLEPNLHTKIVCITPLGREQDVLEKFSNLGYTHILGFLDGGFDTWIDNAQKTEKIKSISAQSFYVAAQTNSSIIDLRKQSEYDKEHLDNTQILPLELNNAFVTSLNTREPQYLFCGGGYRSVIAISYAKNYHDALLINVEGGFGAIKKTALKIIRS